VAGGIGGKGNEGVAAYVKQIKGGIGYVELCYALQNKMAYAAMQNSAGKWVLPSDESLPPPPPAPTGPRRRTSTW
jgi:phosphate transport system substrate-binding protein